MTSAVVTLSHELGGKALKDCIQSGTKLGRLRKLPAMGEACSFLAFQIEGMTSFITSTSRKASAWRFLPQSVKMRSWASDALQCDLEQPQGCWPLFPVPSYQVLHFTSWEKAPWQLCFPQSAPLFPCPLVLPHPLPCWPHKPSLTTARPEKQMHFCQGVHKPSVWG